MSSDWTQIPANTVRRDVRDTPALAGATSTPQGWTPVTHKTYEGRFTPRADKTTDEEPREEALLSLFNAWRVFTRAVGGGPGLSTFYRWVSTRKLSSVRMGYRLFIPLTALEDLIKRCRAGEGV